MESAQKRLRWTLELGAVLLAVSTMLASAPVSSQTACNPLLICSPRAVAGLPIESQRQAEVAASGTLGDGFADGRTSVRDVTPT